MGGMPLVNINFPGRTPDSLVSLFRSMMHRGKGRISTAEEHRLQRMVGPRGVWKESRDFQIEFLRRRGLQPERSVLDIGCGPLRGGIPLVQFLNTGNYVGIDVRAEVIEEAQKQINRHSLAGKEPTILLSDDFGRGNLGQQKFDYVWCFQLFYHLEDHLIYDCLEQISRVLARSGFCYVNVNLTLAEGKWKQFPYVRRPLQFYESMAEKHGLLVKDLGQQRDWGFTTKVCGQFEHMLELRYQSSNAEMPSFS